MHFDTLTTKWLSELNLNEADSSLFFQDILDIRKLAINKKDEDLEMQSYLMELYYTMVLKAHFSDQYVLDCASKVLAQAESLDKSWAIAAIERELGIFYFTRAFNYELAFEHYLENADFKQAIEKLNLARSYIKISGQYHRYEKLYPILSKYHTLVGDGKMTMAYLDSTIIIKDRIATEFNQLFAARAQQKLEREQHKAEIIHLENQKTIKQLERNGLIGLIIGILTLAYIFIRNFWKRFKIKQTELKKANEELKVSKKLLLDFTKQMAEKNKQIETLRTKAGHLQNSTLSELKQITILTEEEWNYFQDLFEKVHHGYLSRLKTKLPQVSPAETRFIALSKLNLSSKEMANILGVGTDAIRQYRSRLRKKLDISEVGGLKKITTDL